MSAARTRALAAVLLFATGLCGCATMGSIHGRLTLAPMAVAAGTDSVTRAARARESVRDAVVYLDPAPAPPGRRASSRVVARMSQRDRRFVPHVLAVPAGATVRFVNHDRIYHHVFSVSPTKRFDIGNCAPGRYRTVRFVTPGVVELFCEVEDRMSGYVFVTPGAAFARPDSAGDFVLKQLPRGDYTIRVWHPSRGTLKRDVQVTGRDSTAVRLEL